MRDKLRILVIDDEPFVREVLCETLRDCGFEVSEAADGDEGLRLIEERTQPHVVLTDIIMPRREGLETIMEIRRRYPAIKLIAMSGGGRTRSADLLYLAERLGADVVLEKPIDPDSLEGAVRRLAVGA